MLVMELPQFYEKRVEYFQPSLQALIRSQVQTKIYFPPICTVPTWGKNIMVGRGWGGGEYDFLVK